MEASHTLTTLLERTITAERTSPWQQFYISFKPDRAAGWQLDGMKLNWLIGDEGGEATGAYTDSLHLPITNVQLSAINFKLEATTTVGMLKLPAPLYLIRWTPQLLIESAENIHKVIDTNGMLHVAALADRDLPFEVDLTVRPCKAPLSSFELNQFALQPMAGYPINFALNYLIASMPIKGAFKHISQPNSCYWRPAPTCQARCYY